MQLFLFHLLMFSYLYFRLNIDGAKKETKREDDRGKGLEIDYWASTEMRKTKGHSFNSWGVTMAGEAF